MFVNADLLRPPGSPLYFITIAFPINWLPEHHFSRCQDMPIQTWDARSYSCVRQYRAILDACHLADHLGS